MRKFLCILCLLLLLPLYSSAINQGVLGTAGKPVDAAGGCTASTGGVDNDEIGLTSAEANNLTLNKGSTHLYLLAADCTGTLEIGYIRHRSTDESDAKIAIYLDDGDNVPDAGDTLVGSASGAITSSGNGVWATDSSTLGGNVTQGVEYFLVIYVDAEAANNWKGYYRGGAATVWRELGADDYDAPPATLSGTYGEAGAPPDIFSAFVAIE